MKWDGVSDIEKLARSTDPTWDHRPDLPLYLRPAFTRTGNLRVDVLRALKERYTDTVVDMARALGTSQHYIQTTVHQLADSGEITWAEVYEILPKTKEAHERLGRKYGPHYGVRS